MTEIQYAEEPLGALKVFATLKSEDDLGIEGWYYPVFVTKEEAMAVDIEHDGDGIYETLVFSDRVGEFYHAQSFIFKGQSREPLVYTNYTGVGAENPYNRIQNRLSVLIPKQLPEFVQDEYQNFIIFLKAYYEFLEQNNQAQSVLHNLSRYSDIDETAEELISKFLGTYSEDYFLSEVSENRLIIKRIRDIYKSKGSEKAYQTLFRILYNETIDFFYPNQYVLKASSGKWQRSFSLRVKPVNTLQNLYDFENTEVVGETSGARAIVSKVIRFNLGESEIFELQLDSSSIDGVFVKEEVINATKLNILNNLPGETLEIKGILYSLVSKIDIIDGTLGYEEGSPIQITDLSGEGQFATAEIGGVNLFGTIKSIDILEPGVNYSNITIADAGLPTVTLYGSYELVVKNRVGSVKLVFPRQHGIKVGNFVNVKYTGNILSPVYNTSHNAYITSVPNVRTVKYRYPLPE
jgi:hypothetical protein